MYTAGTTLRELIKEHRDHYQLIGCQNEICSRRTRETRPAKLKVSSLPGMFHPDTPRLQVLPALAEQAKCPHRGKGQGGCNLFYSDGKIQYVRKKRGPLRTFRDLISCVPDHLVRIWCETENCPCNGKVVHVYHYWVSDLIHMFRPDTEPEQGFLKMAQQACHHHDKRHGRRNARPAPVRRFR